MGSSPAVSPFAFCTLVLVLQRLRTFGMVRARVPQQGGVRVSVAAGAQPCEVAANELAR